MYANRLKPCVLWTAVAIAFTHDVVAAPIGLEDFSGNETVETFDTFPSSLAAATPQTVNGITFQSQGFGAGATGMFKSSQTVHTDLFLNIEGTSGSPVYSDFTLSDFTITFSTPVRRAGLLLSTIPTTSWRVSAQVLADMGPGVGRVPAMNGAAHFQKMKERRNVDS